jgi:hypothetical protein
MRIIEIRVTDDGEIGIHGKQGCEDVNDIMEVVNFIAVSHARGEYRAFKFDEIKEESE